MTTNGIPTGPNNSSANVSPNVVEFINSDMPVPTPGQRDAALGMPTYTGPIPEVQIPSQPQVPQPDPSQTMVPPSISSQPTTPNYEQLYTQAAEQNRQFQERETEFESQRQEVEKQRENAQEQNVQTAAKQYAMQQYQKYLSAGNSDAQAQEWARTDASSMYQAYSFNTQQKQAKDLIENIASKHGVKVSDIPEGMTPQAMDQFALLKSQLNQVQAQSQNTSTNQMQSRQFDSNQGMAPSNPEQQFFNTVGNPNQVAPRSSLAAMYKWMQDNEVQGIS
tara:strand:+ start:438 stop:1271 length:834 start_codon:yes stop_codon:yes gene_type:complete